MPHSLTVEEIVPLVEALPPEERVRLLRLITKPRSDDSTIYTAVPPTSEEFSSNEEALAWDSEGWANVS